VLPGGQAVFMERGGSVDIEVSIIGGNTTKNDVKVKVWVGGYEYGDIEDTSDIKKKLSLDIPEDVDVEDGDYILFVKVYDKSDGVEESFDVFLEEKRHSLKIQDVILRPSSTIKAGSPLFVVVRVENLGAKKEEDIKIGISVPELGISARDYIDELAAQEIANEDEEDSESSNEIFLRIPKEALEGEYTLTVDVEYDRGHRTASTKRIVRVIGEEIKKEEAEALIIVDSTSQSVETGSDAQFRITVMNTGEKANLYSLEVDGEQLFASSKVSPGFLLVKEGESATFDVIMTAKGDVGGIKSFMVKVKDGDKIIKEITLSLDIIPKSYELNNWLVTGFVVLIILLIILGLILLATKGKPEEPGTEGQTYY